MNKRVLHIIGDSKFGGASIIVMEIACCAMNNDYKVDILTTDKEFSQRVKKAGMGVIEKEVIWRNIRPVRDVIGLIKLYIYLKKQKYDIVHTHTSKAGFVGRLAATFARVPLIIHTVHGFAFHEESSKQIIKMGAMLEKIAATACDKIIFVSDFHKKWAEELKIGSKEKRITIQNGVDVRRLVGPRNRKNLSKEYGISADNAWIVTTGRLVRQKGLEYLIEAVEILANKKIGFQVLVIGDGPLRNILEESVKKKRLEGMVRFLGFQKDVGSFISSADVIVMPSLREGLSISLLEAMSLGKPVITTRIGSNIEVITDGVSGVIVPTRDSMALAKKLAELLNNQSECKRLAENAFKRYEESFRSERMTDAYMQIYKSKKSP